MKDILQRMNSSIQLRDCTICIRNKCFTFPLASFLKMIENNLYEKQMNIEINLSLR